MGRFGQWDNGPVSFGDDAEVGTSAPSANPARSFTAPAVQGGGVLPDGDPPESSTGGTGGTVGGAGLDGSSDIQGQNDSIDVGGKSYSRGVLQDMSQGGMNSYPVTPTKPYGDTDPMVPAPGVGPVSTGRMVHRSEYNDTVSRNGIALADGGEVPEEEAPSTDPMQMIMDALTYGRKKAGLPESFYGSDAGTEDATASYEDGGVIQPDQPEPDVTSGGNAPPDPRHTMLYLTGNGAVSPDQAAAIEQHVDPQGQMSEAERTMAAIGSAPDPAKAFQYLQHNRIKANAYSGAAKAAMAKGDLGRAAMSATQAMARTPTGYDVQFAPAKGGLAVMGKRIGGQTRQVQGADEGGVIEPQEYNDAETGGNDGSEGDSPVVLPPQEVQKMLGDYDKLIEHAGTSDTFTNWLDKVRGVMNRAAAGQPLYSSEDRPPAPEDPTVSRIFGGGPAAGAMPYGTEKGADVPPLGDTGFGKELSRQFNQNNPFKRAYDYLSGPSGQRPSTDDTTDSYGPRPDNTTEPEPTNQGVIPNAPPKPRPTTINDIPGAGGRPRQAGSNDIPSPAPRREAPRPVANDRPAPSAETLRRGWEIQDPNYRITTSVRDKSGNPLREKIGPDRYMPLTETTQRRGSQTLPTQSQQTGPPRQKSPLEDKQEEARRVSQNIWPGTGGEPNRQAFQARMFEHNLQNQGRVDQETARDRAGIAQRAADARTEQTRIGADSKERIAAANQLAATARAGGHDRSREQIARDKNMLSQLTTQQNALVRLSGQQLAADPTMADNPAKLWDHVTKLGAQIGVNDPHAVMDMINASRMGNQQGQPQQGAQPQARPPAQGGGKTMVYPSGPYAGKRVRQLPNGQVEVLD